MGLLSLAVIEIVNCEEGNIGQVVEFFHYSFESLIFTACCLLLANKSSNLGKEFIVSTVIFNLNILVINLRTTQTGYQIRYGQTGPSVWYVQFLIPKRGREREREKAHKN